MEMQSRTEQNRTEHNWDVVWVSTDPLVPLESAADHHQSIARQKKKQESLARRGWRDGPAAPLRDNFALAKVTTAALWASFNIACMFLNPCKSLVPSLVPPG
jgi:hypothetical protein